MDLNGDGKVDILSGSYSRQDKDMAGLFHVLWGAEGGGFREAVVLNGTDGQPLIITADETNLVDKICTRPTAVDSWTPTASRSPLTRTAIRFSSTGTPTAR